jgi:hypothetical protein
MPQSIITALGASKQRNSTPLLNYNFAAAAAWTTYILQKPTQQSWKGVLDILWKSTTGNMEFPRKTITAI